MMKFYTTLFVSLCLWFVTEAQGTESFTNIPAANGSYIARTWTGDNGLSWGATDARTDQTITGAAICIRDGSVTCTNIPDGIGSLTFKHQQVFSGTNPVLEVRINGTLVGTVNPTATIATATINNINITGSFSLEIKQITSGLRISIDDISWTGASSDPPCVEPTAQPTALVLTPGVTSIAGSFTAASPAADQYLVVKSSSASLSSQPVDGATYSVGQSLGGGTVVSSGSSLSFNTTGLTASTNFYFFVYALNSFTCSLGPNYLLTNPLTGNTTTLAPALCSAPTAAPTNLSLTSTNTSITGTFTASASANRYLVVKSLTSSLSANPVNGTVYTNGQALGGGTVVAYNSSTSFLASGLTINTTYYLFVFAANAECTGEPVYNTSPLTVSKATANTPTNLPPTYYNTANGLTCSALKTALSTIISTGTIELTYTPGVWDAFARTDKRRNDANTADIVWDMYSDNPNGTDPYTFTFISSQCGNYSKEGDCYNREHSFPKSWFNDGTPMYSDINHLFPTDGKVNGIRDNYPYGETSSPSYTSQNGSKLGPSSFPGYTGIVFEPINEYKGDFARAQFYMVTRYESLVASWQNNGNANDILNGTSYQAFDDWELKLLYKWHLQDPVSQKEISRNDSVFVIQGNRNPYIDHPEWVTTVWSCTGVIDATGVNDLLRVSQKAVWIYPNPIVNKTATVKLEKPFTQTVSLQVIDMMGRVLKHQTISAGQTMIQLQVNELNAGIYSIRINTAKGIMTKTFVVQ